MCANASSARSEFAMTNEPVIRPIKVAPNSLLALHAAHPSRYPVLLDSAATGVELGRFDILFAHPEASMTLERDGTLIDHTGAASPTSFLEALDRWWRELYQPTSASRLPFLGGWFVYLGYELAGQIESRLRLHSPAAGPIALAMRIPAAVIVEHASASAWIVAESQSATLIDSIARDLETLAETAAPSPSLLESEVLEDAPSRYIDSVRRALDHIGAGDIYQANLSRAWRARLRPGVQPHDVYRRLRKANPGPFNALAVLHDLAIVSSSPERLVRVHDGWVSTRPIAGTRPRGEDAEADQDLVHELHAHPKERAEHIMLIDLERNDLGRVCEPGSVEVDEYMTIETYAHVHHIVSNVRGRLRRDVAPGEVLAAVFPGGTITGCPKVRCMEIIAELEGVARGAYTGSLGYLNRDGSMDLNILIRSLEMHGADICLRAGAGIVADSIPERELEESRAKARGVLRALSGEAL
jgi:anthranilate synthase component I